MKPSRAGTIAVNLSLICSFVVFPGIVNSQINVYPGLTVTPGMMVENITGKGIEYENIQFQGANNSRGTFTNGQTTNLGISYGIFLCSGNGYNIPGPNNSGSAGTNNGMPGHPLLTSITITTTYDAAVLAFNFYPESDTILIKYVYGSEEYPGWNLSSIDVFGFFVSGPNPAGGFYNNKVMARIPDTSANFSVYDYMYSNCNGQTLQYNGFTTVLSAGLPVIPFESYHILLGVADVGDGIYDSGVFIEENSLMSPGPTDFISFDFLSDFNLIFNEDYFGTILNDTVLVYIPIGLPREELTASFNTRPGVEVYVGEQIQESSITVNDFSEPLTYSLVSWNGLIKDYHVIVDYMPNTGTSILSYAFEAANNPGLNQDCIATISDTTIIVDIHKIDSGGLLVATFNLSDSARLYVNDVLQESGVTATDFTSIANYQVVAAAGNTQDYSVAVRNSANHFISYGFDPAYNPGLSEFVSGIIGEENIHLYLPQGPSLTGLVATFSLPLQAESYVFGEIQQSEVTPNNFTNPKIYNVEAGYGSVKDWLVIVQTTVGTDEPLTESVDVFPNPVADFLNVRNAHNATLQLYSVMGKMVLETIIQGDDCRIDLSSIKEGIYFLRITTSVDELVRKLIISRAY